MDWQSGGDADFLPSNWSSYIGNDDQMVWALASMTAAEMDFPQSNAWPVSWLTMAENVFNIQIGRWDDTLCGGGMRWQIWSYESGFTVKTAFANGGLFQLSARLARYTGNATYSDWAEKIWNWSASSPLLDTTSWQVADSTSTENGCASQSNIQWTYNYGAYISGAAYMYNLVRQQISPMRYS